jgi:lipopolysaccharide transport system ATP-binding protein
LPEQDWIAKLENVGKRYRICVDGGRQRYVTLRETVTSGLGRIFDKSAPKAQEFWALKDVSLEVAAGETVGILGRNGAGKSTLLRILSRITTPTLGKVRLKGRVSSLLEVGTGFHPELTARENLYLNGAILGMRKKEIQRKADAILDFAGIRKFAQTPIKRFSSGMQVRLAFSIAAHLEPDILVLDEVLAIGDIGFQRECLARMREIAVSGRSLVIVSHDLAMMEQICSRAILMEAGRMCADGAVPEVIAQYVKGSCSDDAADGFARPRVSHVYPAQSRSARQPGLWQ